MVVVYIETYGCTLSRSESEAIEHELNGRVVVEKPEDAQVIVLNTCVVTETTERKVLKRIAALLDNLKGRTLIVTGCATKVLGSRISARYPGVFVMDSKLVAPFINSRFKSAETAYRLYNHNSITARVKIAEGCNGRCSYCIVRLARGQARSRSVEAIVRDIESRLRRGAKQVFLAAQDAAVYGVDTGSNLPELINAICGLQHEFKLRIGMMNVTSMSHMMSDLLDSFNDPKIYKFFHLPVQSGSERILKLMEREHTVLDFKRCVCAFSRRFQDMTLSTDFIVGFPTETEDDFQATLKLLKETKPVKVNITRFSQRPGTPAASLDPVTSRIVKERSRTLTAEHHRVAYQQNCTRVGAMYTALAAEYGTNSSTVLYNDSYRPIVVPQVLPLGAPYEVRVTWGGPTYLRGAICLAPL